MAKNAVKPHSAEPSAAVHAAVGDALLSLATDDTFVAQTTPSAASNVADARGDTPREDDPSLAVDYECESDDMADSGDLNSRLIVFRRLIMSLQMRELIQ